MYCLFPIALIIQWRKGFKNPAYWQHWRERWGAGEQLNIDLWIHAVSVGEMRAISTLVKRILVDHPDTKILLTMTTPTGRQTAETLFKNDIGKSVTLSYLPYDTGNSVRRFLKRIKPKLGVVVETEVWPNLVANAEKLGIPMMYTNVRLSERSFNKYNRWAKFSRKIFSKISFFAIQSPADAVRVNKLGVPVSKIEVTGNIKFDLSLPPSLNETAQGLLSMILGNRTILIAGSTRDEEEEKLLAIFKRLKQAHPDLLLMLVPRHPERFDLVAKLCKQEGFSVVRRTAQPNEISEDIDIYLGDTIGDLSLLYATADIAFVGGSLVEFGGQNILEPCALGKPVIFGPYMYNFEEISKLTLEADAGIQVLTPQQLETTISDLINDPNRRDEIGENGKQLVEEHKGALDRITSLIAPYIR